jgi:glyoxylase-like metal-dependent hydrolase (beta-lactamase superfamily II)
MAIAFQRALDFAYGVPARVSPLIRRVVSDNPGPFTYFGTGVYIVGDGEVAVIDPGPDQPGQREMLLNAIGAARVAAILVTHGHLDHSPMARPLAHITGAPIYASGAPIAPGETGEEGDDLGFKPDVALADGQTISGPGWTLEAITTPGHASDHVCFALPEENALFSGDHVMGWSTSVVSPPDGDMDAYLASLEKICARRFAKLWPTHGPPIDDVDAFIAALIAHRLEREAQILSQLAAGKTRIADIVAVLYANVDKRLHGAAAHSVLAHLIRLVRAGRVRCEGAPALTSCFAPT